MGLCFLTWIFLHIQDRNEKNLSLSKLNLEKRTLQRQYDHMREQNRTLTNKLQSIQKELDQLRSKTPRERILSSQTSINIERHVEDDTTANGSISVDTTLNEDTEDAAGALPSMRERSSVGVRRESSTVRELSELLEKVKVLETRNQQLDTQNKELEEELKDSTNACIKISERYVLLY